MLLLTWSRRRSLDRARARVQEVQGKGYLSKAADMYSFGVLLWEMFHGMPPYAADNGHLVNNASFPRFDLRHREDAPFSYVVVALACLSNEYDKRCALAWPARCSRHVGVCALAANLYGAC
jgi:serine/threonine protein kinase